MSENAYETASIAGLATPSGWSPIRKQLNVQSFGVNAWTAREDGESLVGEHDEAPSGHEELYIVIAGHASFTVNGEEIDGPTGTIVFVRDPAAKRAAVARDAGTTILAAGGEPGAVYRPRAWETNAQVFPMFGEGKYTEVKAILEDALDRYDDRAALYYNLACAEARLGETDAALGHLATALEQRPSFGEQAREDEDLESLRDDPRFDELVGAPAAH